MNKGFTTEDGMILHYPYHSVETGNAEQSSNSRKIQFLIRNLWNFTGALVSAGFEVSATVVHGINQNDNKNGAAELTAIVTNADLTSQQKRRQMNMEAASSIASTNKLKANDHLITMDSMVDWLTKGPENEL